MHVEIKNTAFGRECNVPWESMQELEPGCRFCAHCSREIRDFSKLSRQEVKSLLKENKDLCGVFDIHQFAYEVKLPSPKWLMGMLIPVWLMVEPEVALGTERKVEKSILAERNDSIAKTSIREEKEEIKSEHRMLPKHSRRRLYLSKRFPFIHIRKRHRFGGAPRIPKMKKNN
jgi:hypothetical protein